MKVALVISGMLRNFDTALLSIHIFGEETDRYLVTWASVGELLVDQYCTHANIKKSIIINDYILPEIIKSNNTYRMLYLWEYILTDIPKIYDKYIIIRPDGFYWTTNIVELSHCILNIDSFKTNSWKDKNPTGLINDHLLVVDKTHVYLLHNICNSIIHIQKTKDNKNPFDIHWSLYEYRSIFVDPYHNDLVSLVDCVFVRDTFLKLKIDVYDYELYKAVFYDTASWWRRNKHSPYAGVLRFNDNR